MDTDAWLKGGLSEVLRRQIVQTDLRDKGETTPAIQVRGSDGAHVGPRWLQKAAGLEDCARELQALIPIADPLTAKAAGNLLSTVSLRAIREPS